MRAPVLAFDNSQLWHDAGFKVTQYWAKGAGTFRDNLHVVVNGRYTYWRSSQPIPGGVAFENFEIRERFYAGQRFIFGTTRSTPAELGFGNQTPPVSVQLESTGHQSRNGLKKATPRKGCI